MKKGLVYTPQHLDKAYLQIQVSLNVLFRQFQALVTFRFDNLVVVPNRNCYLGQAFLRSCSLMQRVAAANVAI